MDENLMYSATGDRLFGNNATNLISHCSSKEALPQLALSGSDKNFPDNIVSVESSQLVSNLALLSEPLPLSLPEIEATFSQISTCSQTNFRPCPNENDIHLSSYFDRSTAQLELPFLTPSCAANQSHNSCEFVSNLQHEPLMTTCINSPVSSQPHVWNVGPQYGMNCNNNNVNDSSRADNRDASFFVHSHQVIFYTVFI